MHPDVHLYLDGELSRAELSADALAELSAWERLEGSIVQRRAEIAPAGLADAVMRSLHATLPHNDPSAPQRASSAPTSRAAESGWRRAWSWLVTPQPLHVPPLAPVAAAAVIAALLVVPRTGWLQSGPPDGLATADGRSALELDAEVAGSPVIYVQFALRAPDATSVAVAGDFNDWSPEGGELRDPHGDGVWLGLIAVQPGVHKYMFVVNGDEWVTDPVAERYVDDGFGMRNALLAVAPPPDAL